MPEGDTHHTHSDCETHSVTAHKHTCCTDRPLTSASLDDINLRTTCLRYSKLISRESLRSDVLVTVVLVVGGLGADAGGSSGKTLSCFSARLSGSFSFTSASGSGFSFYRDQRKEKNTSFFLYLHLTLYNVNQHKLILNLRGEKSFNLLLSIYNTNIQKKTEQTNHLDRQVSSL